uniref:Uncharacterized protein n=1 Tax=Arundo donax TaxID=35708 RepID=A0A0A9ECT7_ARUDO
MSRVTLQKAE